MGGGALRPALWSPTLAERVAVGICASSGSRGLVREKRPQEISRARSFSGNKVPRPLPTPGASPEVSGREEVPHSGSWREGFGT